MDTLKVIGQQLDRNIFPLVKNGGIVTPNTSTANLSISGMEQEDGERKSRRSETRERERASRGQRQTRRPWWWQTCDPTPVISPSIKALCEEELNSIKCAYPGTQVWLQDEGMWLLTKSAILPECWHDALFFTGISFIYPFNIRSWGFWTGGLLRKPVWIGPRHTNFPDGSVCAFEPSDQTWSIGQPIVSLLDIYTLWALRHFHLEVFGRWPGYQAVHHPYERGRELNPDEFCGCGLLPSKRYRECCQEKDLKRDRVADAVDFLFFTGWKPRTPPESILKFIWNQNAPPSTRDLLS